MDSRFFDATVLFPAAVPFIEGCARHVYIFSIHISVYVCTGMRIYRRESSLANYDLKDNSQDNLQTSRTIITSVNDVRKNNDI